MVSTALPTYVRRTARHPSCQDGFTYLGLLFFIALLGVATAATIQVGSISQRRAAEEELLAIGKEMRNALISYANATPAGQKRTPNSLHDLIRDPRFPLPRRHLRKVYADPITGKAEWGLVELKQGSGILGIYSLSTAQPIKNGNFEPGLEDLNNKSSFQEWKFMVDARYTVPGTILGSAPKK